MSSAPAAAAGRIILRDYQIDALNRTRQSLLAHRRTILQAPTGAGKTAIACYMMASAAARGKRAFFVVHQNELLRQTSRALWTNGMQHGLIVPNRARSKLPVQLASIMTLKNRLQQYPDPDLLIIDEAHRALAPSYLKIADRYPRAAIVGLTATPQRTDGKGLGHLFADIVQGPSIRQLIDAGYLCDYELLGPPVGIDLSGVRTRAGDFDAHDLERAANKREITGDAVDHYRRHASGKSAVVMCVSVQHAEDVAAEFAARGIPARALHGESADREGILKKFERRDFLVLTSVQLMIEGVDLPFIEAVIWLRPTQSLTVFMQGNGRGLRPSPGKTRLTILDHVGNYTRHGLPDSPREWSLADRARRKSGESGAGLQTCKHCYHVFTCGVRKCPHCGAEVEFKQRKEIEIKEGELQRIDAAIAAQHQRREQAQARSVEELIALGIRRNMRNPAGWAANIHAAREKRRPSREEYNAARVVEQELRRRAAA